MVEETTNSTQEAVATDAGISDTGNNATFSQEDVNKIVSARVKSKNREHEAALAELNELKTKLSQFESDASERTNRELAEQNRFKELFEKSENDRKKLQADLDNFNQQLSAERIRREITDAAAAHNAIDPTEVYALMQGSIKTQNGQTQIVDANGNMRYKLNSPEPMSVSDAVGELLGAKPHLVRQKSGANISINSPTNHKTGGETLEQVVKNMQNPEYRAEYRRKRGIR